jgi:hypothetical protein
VKNLKKSLILTTDFNKNINIENFLKLLKEKRGKLGDIFIMLPVGQIKKQFRLRQFGKISPGFIDRNNSSLRSATKKCNN